MLIIPYLEYKAKHPFGLSTLFNMAMVYKNHPIHPEYL